MRMKCEPEKNGENGLLDIKSTFWSKNKRQTWGAAWARSEWCARDGTLEQARRQDNSCMEDLTSWWFIQATHVCMTACLSLQRGSPGSRRLRKRTPETLENYENKRRCPCDVKTNTKCMSPLAEVLRSKVHAAIKRWGRSEQVIQNWKSRRTLGTWHLAQTRLPIFKWQKRFCSI